MDNNALLLSTLGIDPGLSGAVALWDGANLIVHDVPVITIKVGKTNKRRLDNRALASLLWYYSNFSPALALTENVNGYQGQSASAAFAFGAVAEAIAQSVVCNDIDLARTHPAVWKRALGLVGQDKSASRRAACDLFPAFAHYFKRVKDDGRAEAALLAYYARQNIDRLRANAGSAGRRSVPSRKARGVSRGRSGARKNSAANPRG